MAARRKSASADDMSKVAGCLHYLAESFRAMVTDDPEGVSRVLGQLAVVDQLSEELFDKYAPIEERVNGQVLT